MSIGNLDILRLGVPHVRAEKVMDIRYARSYLVHTRLVGIVHTDSGLIVGHIRWSRRKEKHRSGRVLIVATKLYY